MGTGGEGCCLAEEWCAARVHVCARKCGMKVCLCGHAGGEQGGQQGGSRGTVGEAAGGAAGGIVSRVDSMYPSHKHRVTPTRPHPDPPYPPVSQTLACNSHPDPTARMPHYWPPLALPLLFRERPHTPARPGRPPPPHPSARLPRQQQRRQRQQRPLQPQAWGAALLLLQPGGSPRRRARPLRWLHGWILGRMLGSRQLLPYRQGRQP